MLQTKTVPMNALVRDMWAAHGLRLLRFGVVGISGVLINSGVLFVLVSFLGVHHLLAAAFSSEVSILTNFALNDRWTFGDARTGSSRLRRGFQYNSVAFGGMAISVCVLAVLTAGLGMYYLIANLFAIGAATVSNYLLNTRFTWTLPARSTQHRAPRFGMRPYELEAVTVPVSRQAVSREP